jgi:hypothetical protein
MTMFSSFTISALINWAVPLTCSHWYSFSVLSCGYRNHSNRFLRLCLTVSPSTHNLLRSSFILFIHLLTLIGLAMSMSVNALVTALIVIRVFTVFESFGK